MSGSSSMNRLLLILAMLLLQALSLSGQGYAALFESETAASMREASAVLAGAGEKEAADYVREGFRSRGLDILDSPDDRSFGILSRRGDTTVCHNAVAWIKGYDRSLSGKYIVVGAPIEGNASGLAILLELARKLSTNSVLLRKSVVLAAFGAASENNAGSWYFLNRSFAADAANIESMVDLFQLGDGGRGFYAYTASLLPLAGGSRVLDLGCGTGLELEEYFVLNPGAAVTGIDLSEAMLNVLKAKFPDKGLTLIHASYFDAPLGSGQYDAAVSVESLHHFPAERKTSLYEKLHSALAEKGVFVLIGGNGKRVLSEPCGAEGRTGAFRRCFLSL